MADTLVERVTGRPADVPVPIAVNLVVSDEAMFGGSTEPALIDGYGPIPAAVARRLADAAVGDKRSKATLPVDRHSRCDREVLNSPPPPAR